MQCIQAESPESFPVVAGETLTYWPKLQVAEKAFVIAYIENSYSLQLAAEATETSASAGKALLKNPDIRAAINEVQEQLGSIDFLNEKWVKAQLLRLFPMVMGDEMVPLVTAQGETIEVHKFQPDIAMRIIEYVAPKKTTPAVSVTINNASRLSDADLEKIAMRGKTYDAE